MNALQRQLARHALGLPNFRRVSFRNRYAVPYAPTRDFEAWEALADAGMAESNGPRRSGLMIFWLTREGAEAALEPGETLCPQDFPKEKPHA